ncbi:NACHT domain-containing protein [Streptomyces sp. NPDC048680]|uniref:NACHT domain-containing protein n=1 Tax=Streptomyces sp. NPDC048680 TaxID=3155492 RepID=UPI00344613CA
MLTKAVRRDRRKWQVVAAASAVAILGSLVFAVWAIVTGEELSRLDIATLAGVPIAVIGLAVAAVALRRSVEGKEAELARANANRLAEQVWSSERRVKNQLLGADTQRINLTYDLQPATTRASTAPEVGFTFADEHATLPNVLQYYHSTQHQRLVVTGAAGAGKTVLALELMLALIDGRTDGQRVPVRISLAQWNTAQPLSTLLVKRLVDTYGFTSREANGLIDRELVLPVLDGLDEMDRLRPDGTPDPEAPRARAALEQLNGYRDGSEPGPLVLTCRTGHYDALAPVPVSESRLIDAAHVVIAPIDTRRAIDYLRGRMMDAHRWQRLIDHLDTQPTSPLATTLSTPWRLCLTATVYRDEGNPSELLDHTSGDELDQHLLSRYIRAAIGNPLKKLHPHNYEPNDVHHWLHHLARPLVGTVASAPATDITLHQLWTLAGTTRVRIADLILTFLVIAPVCYLAPFPDEVFSVSRRSDHTLLAIGMAALASLAVFRPTPSPNRLHINRGTPQGRFRSRFWAGFKAWFAVGLVDGLAIGLSEILNDPELAGEALSTFIPPGVIVGVLTGLIGGSMSGLAGGFAGGFKAWFMGSFAVAFVFLGLLYLSSLPLDDVDFPFGVFLFGVTAVGVALGLVGGLVGGFMRGFKAVPTVATVVDPREVLRGDMVYGLLIGPLVGLMAALLVGLVVGSAAWLDGQEDAVGNGLIGGTAVGVAAVCVVGLASGFARAARRYMVFLLCSRGNLPFRLWAFLDWAVKAGLLRYSGSGYQFRHRELQQWLADNPRPLPHP